MLVDGLNTRLKLITFMKIRAPANTATQKSADCVVLEMP